MMKLIVVVPTHRPQDWSNILSNIKRQSHQPDAVIAVENGDHPSWTSEATITVQSEENVGLARQKGLEVLKDKYPGSYFVMMDGDDYYGPSYLEESFLHKDKAEIIGKHKVFYKFESTNVLAISEGAENDYAQIVHGPTMAGHTDNAINFYQCPGWGEDMCWQKRMCENGARIYSTSRFNFCGLRKKDAEGHTWYVPDYIASQCMHMKNIVKYYTCCENVVNNTEQVEYIAFESFSFEI